MTYYSEPTDIASAPSGAEGRFQRFLSRLMQGLTRQAAADARRARIAALEAKSDAELTRMGIRREDIAYHVFKDLYYI